jgi:hypothetical protein
MTRILNIAIVIVLSGCSLIPCNSNSELDSLNAKPKDDELVGTYLPDRRTLLDIPGIQTNSKMILTKDHKFVFENIPKSTFHTEAFYNESYDLVNGIGEWQSDFTEYTAELFVKVDEEELNSEGKFDFATSWKIYKYGKKHVIFIIVGDPDECAAIRLIQK